MVIQCAIWSRPVHLNEQKPWNALGDSMIGKSTLAQGPIAGETQHVWRGRLQRESAVEGKSSSSKEDGGNSRTSTAPSLPEMFHVLAPAVECRESRKRALEQFTSLSTCSCALPTPIIQHVAATAMAAAALEASSMPVAHLNQRLRPPHICLCHRGSQSSDNDP